MFNFTIDLYSKRTGKFVESKSFYTKEMAQIYYDARIKEGLWNVYWRS